MGYLKFSLAGFPQFIDSLIQCYRDVFAGEPWNEWKRCPACGQQYGYGQCNGSTCQCGHVLVDFWPPGQVRADLSAELGKDAICWLAIERNNEVVGFVWSYPLEAPALEAKVGLSGAAAAIRQFNASASVAYLDEIGVARDFRRQGIARHLYTYQVNELCCYRGINTLVTRTKGIPSAVAYGWFLRLGFQVIARYSAPDDRVILARSVSVY